LKKSVLISTIVIIIAIAGAQYLKISICSPFNLEKLYSEIEECKIIGTVIDEQKETENFYKYVLKVEKLNQKGDSINKLENTKLLLIIEKKNEENSKKNSEKNDKNISIENEKVINEKDEKNTNEKDINEINHKLKNTKNKNYNNKIDIGDRIILNCKIQIPDGNRNFGSYNYKMYLKTIGIHASVKASENEVMIIKKNNLSIIDKSIFNIKYRIEKNLERILSYSSYGVCLGILLGDTRYISDEINENFKNSNLLHMLAVSGSHVSYIVLSLEKFTKRLNKKIQQIILIIFLIFFIKLTGATSSVTRSGIMGILILLAWIFRKKSNVLTNICTSCLILVLINPYSIFNLGFQLSYLGTIGIVLYFDIIYDTLKKRIDYIIEKYNINKYIDRIITYIVKTICISISANILIMPLLIYYYNKISFVFILSNLLVSYLFEIILLIGFIVVIISLFSLEIANFISPLLELLLKILNYLSEYSANFSKYDIIICTPKILTLLVVYGILILSNKKILKKKIIRKKILKIIIILYLCFSIISYMLDISKTDLKIFFIDVGQGDSSLIITKNNKKILIDGGGNNTDFDVGEKILIPYLLDRKINEIDYILISHFDSDHCKGIFTVMEKMKVKNICVSSSGQLSENYNKFLEIANSKKINIIWVESGNKIQIDKNTYIDILWTGDTTIKDNIINNYSITCKITYNNYKILFTGDIESIAEEKIINKYKNDELKSDIIKIPHHGSKSSSTEKFIKAVSPEIALIGVGKNNNFGHPNLGVINRLNALGIKIYRTDINGEIEISINKGISVKKMIE